MTQAFYITATRMCESSQWPSASLSRSDRATMAPPPPLVPPTTPPPLCHDSTKPPPAPPTEFPGTALSLLPAFRRSSRTDKEKLKRLDIWSSLCDDIIMKKYHHHMSKVTRPSEFGMTHPTCGLFVVS